jgi:tetratricopeptide (TPR) repeat protein
VLRFDFSGNRLLIALFVLLTNAVFAQLPTTLPAEQPDLVRSSPLQKPDSLFLALKKKYNRAVEQQDRLTEAVCLAEMGRVCYHLGHYPQSLDYHLQAGKLFRQVGKPAQVANNLNEIGELYYYSKQPQRARQYYNQALSIHQSLKNRLGVAVSYGNIGFLYEKQQRYDSAFYYQRQALHHYQQIGNKPGMAKIYENLGSIFEDLARYDSARYYFQNALQLNDQTGDKIGRIEIINNLGDVLRKTGRYRESLQLSKEAVVLASKTGEQHQLSGAYNDIAKGFILLGKPDSAFYYVSLSRQYLKEIYSEEGNKQLALLQTMYDLERKNSEIEKLTIARNVNRIIAVAFTVVILLLGVSGFLVISRQRLKIKSEQALRAQNQHIFETRHELIQAELKNKALEEENLKTELEVKARELTTHTLHIIHKNQVLDELRSKLEDMAKDDKRDHKKQIRQLLNRINQGFQHDHYWEEFRSVFEQVHQAFFDNLKKHNESLTGNDLRLAALLKMNLESGDIATLLGISQDSLRVIRYRLRKKFNLQQGESLTAFIQSL